MFHEAKTSLCESFTLIMRFITFGRESSLHVKCSENPRTQCIEKMDNKTIQKLRELYFKVST